MGESQSEILTTLEEVLTTSSMVNTSAVLDEESAQAAIDELSVFAAQALGVAKDEVGDWLVMRYHLPLGRTDGAEVEVEFDLMATTLRLRAHVLNRSTAMRERLKQLVSSVPGATCGNMPDVSGWTEVEADFTAAQVPRTPARLIADLHKSPELSSGKMGTLVFVPSVWYEGVWCPVQEPLFEEDYRPGGLFELKKHLGGYLLPV